MRRKSIFLCFIFLVAFSPFVLSQQAALGIEAITPTTPEAGVLSRAGNIPINTATGQMTYSVPLHNISVGGNSWPISLTYNYGGFIAETKPSLTGWGWNLNAYGAITKVVRGLPDFHPDGYYGEMGRKQLIDQFVATDNIDAMHFEDFMKFANNEYDSEADKFIVNIGGANFSFKLYYDDASQQYKPHFLSKHNFKVDITMLNFPNEIGSFVVTDDKGVKYYFDSDDREVIVDPQDTGHPYNIDKTTSWLLSRIKYLNGEQIVFDYTPDTYISWDFSASAITSDGATTADPNYLAGFLDEFTGVYNDKMNQTTMTRQVLTSITFPKGSLTFNTLDGPSGHKVFESIILKDYKGVTVYDYEIDYQGGRDALVEIRKNDELLFGFDYFNIDTGGIPGFYEGVNNKPLNQDLWGFYNGSNNNTEAIDHPFNEQVDKAISFGDTRKGAMSKITYPTGGYTKINYEQNTVKKLYNNSNLGGSDNSITFNRTVYLDLDAKLSNNDRHTEVTKTFNYPVRANLNHRIIGNIDSGNAIYLRIERLDGPDVSQYNECYEGIPAFHAMRYPLNVDDARNRMIPPNSNDPGPCDNYYPNPILSPAFIINKDPDNNCAYWNVNGATNDWYGCDSQTTINQAFNSGVFWILPGTYRFVISTHTNANQNLASNLAFDDLFADMRLRYYLPSGADEDTDVSELYVNDPAAGIRVFSIENYDDIQGEATNTILYNYNDEDGFSTAQENQIPLNVEKHHIDIILSDGSQYRRDDTYYRLNSFGAMDAHNGIPVYYKKVHKFYGYGAPIPSNGNNGNTGGHPLQSTDSTAIQNQIPQTLASGVETFQYQMPFEDRTFKYPARPIHLDKSKAKLILSEMKRGNDVIAYQENDYAQIRPFLEPNASGPQDFSANHPWSFKIAPKQLRLVNEFSNCYELGNTECYEAIRELYEVIRYKEVESYFEVVHKESMQDQIKITYDYNLDPESDYTLVKEQIMTSSKGESHRKVFEYPINRTDESQYQSMVNRNQISIPVVEKNYLDDQLMSSQKIDYILHIDGYHPEKVKGNKGNIPLNNLETLYTIDSYDSKGNVTQTHREDGQPVAYLWGYDRQYPIAKVENATLSEVLIALEVSPTTLQNLDGADLRIELDKVRDNLSNALVTTYTYKPLVGVTSVTDPRGYTMYYQYDTQNRLKLVKDQDGKVYSKNEYHYSTSN